MNMQVIHGAPHVLKPISSQLIWTIKPVKNEVYLTFDDGPHPEITPWVLKQLAAYNMKATFFLVGENVTKYPETKQLILDQGHHIGNHTYNHLKGWNTSSKQYFRNTLKCENVVSSTLFRPPHGRITRAQYTLLSKRYRIIMWSVLSGDYDRNLHPTAIVNGVVKNTAPGSVIVFHDSIKAEKNLKASLPEVLKRLSANGLTSKAIPYQVKNSPMVRGEGAL